MRMNDLSIAFEERLEEIQSYLDLLESLEKQVQKGIPQFGKNGPVITVQQQRILYSSVYLQLYNLVESTISLCLEAISQRVVNEVTYPIHLSDSLRRQWVRFIARTHTELNYENRLEFALSLCDHLVQSIPISEFKIEKGAGGGWEDESIDKIIREQLGFSFKIKSDVYTGIKRPFKDDLGPLKLVKDLRNKLAHGSLSFAECGEGTTVSELRELTKCTSSYLREVVACLQLSMDSYEFLIPERAESKRSLK